MRVTDPHAYRPAISDRCLIGVCSMNNCLYPDCESYSMVRKNMGTIHTEGTLTDRQRDKLVASGYREVSEGVWKDGRPNTYRRVTLIIVVVALVLGFFWRQHG